MWCRSEGVPFKCPHGVALQRVSMVFVDHLSRCPGQKRDRHRIKPVQGDQIFKQQPAPRSVASSHKR